MVCKPFLNEYNTQTRRPIIAPKNSPATRHAITTLAFFALTVVIPQYVPYRRILLPVFTVPVSYFN